MIGQAIQGKHCEQMQLAVCTAECQNGRLYPFLSPPDGLIHFFHRVFHGKCEKKPGFPTMFSTFSTEFSTFSEGRIYTRCIFRRGGSRFFRQERAFPPFFLKESRGSGFTFLHCALRQPSPILPFGIRGGEVFHILFPQKSPCGKPRENSGFPQNKTALSACRQGQRGP